MKTIVEKIIQLRNPRFAFDPALTDAALCSFVASQIRGIVRGWKLLLFGKNPKMAILGKRVSFFNTPKIKFGRFIKLGNDVHLSALGREGITLGDHVGIGAFSRVIVSTTLSQIGESIVIGHNVGIGEYAYLGGAGGLEIGDECIIGQYFSCHPENHITTELNIAIRHQGVSRRGIKIGRNCWIGSRVTVLDGVEIGEGCIVAAGAVVTQSFPPNSVIGGVPAKILKQRALSANPSDLLALSA
jgi:acetyltransferase-like isoleucine patch superfamily enzyme